MQYAPEHDTYVYFRYNNNKTVMVAVNSSDKEIALDTKRFSERMNGFTKGTDIITDAIYNSIESIKLPAKTVTVLELSK